jgi:hypothetical protein
VRSAALRNNVAGTAFTLATLRGNPQFELHFVEGHAGARMASDFSVGHSAAHADDHGSEGALAGWLKEPDYKYEFVAFAIAMAFPLTARRPCGSHLGPHPQ